MKELSLHLLDIAQNSFTAQATKVAITLRESEEEDVIEITVVDNGCGMSQEFLQQVTDPFTTTRTTRKVGLGLPLFKLAAEMSEGSFSIASEVGQGTEVSTTFKRSHLDCPPLGDLAGTIITLLQGNPDIDLLYTHITDKGEFILDTNQIRLIMEDVAINDPMVLEWIKQFLEENIAALSVDS